MSGLLEMVDMLRLYSEPGPFTIFFDPPVTQYEAQQAAFDKWKEAKVKAMNPWLWLVGEPG